MAACGRLVRFLNGIMPVSTRLGSLNVA